jgi:hypothetical protein
VLEIIDNFTRHDFNAELGGISFLDSYPEWDNSSAMDMWKNYAKKTFSMSGSFIVKIIDINYHVTSGSSNQVPPPKKVPRKATFVLETDELGCPKLPVEDPKNHKDLESFLRQYCTALYCGLILLIYVNIIQ